MLVGFEVTAVNVPVPKVNPAEPYSTFQAVSVPPAAQPKSRELFVTLEALKEPGFWHDGVSLNSTSSKRISL